MLEYSLIYEKNDIWKKSLETIEIYMSLTSTNIDRTLKISKFKWETFKNKTKKKKIIYRQIQN